MTKSKAYCKKYTKMRKKSSEKTDYVKIEKITEKYFSFYLLVCCDFFIFDTLSDIVE